MAASPFSTMLYSSALHRQLLFVYCRCMADPIAGREGDLAAICTVAGRIRCFFEEIQQGHALGVSPGPHDEPWTLEYQRLGVVIYAETLPWKYLLRVGSGFEACSQLMMTLPVPAELVSYWSLVHSYLWSTSKAIVEGADEQIERHERMSASDIGPLAPAIINFGTLATLVSVNGAATLVQAARMVETSCGWVAECPITELERRWLKRYSRGERTLDLATHYGYSERNFYRMLNKLWQRMGVDNRAEAVTKAIKNGWI